MKRILVLTSALVLSACGSHDPSNGSPDNRLLSGAPSGALIASVDTETISEPLLTAYMLGRGLTPDDGMQRQQALESLIDTLLLAREALDRGTSQQPEVQANLALLRVQYLANHALADFQQTTEITDAQVMDFYQEEVKRSGTTEWRLDHILFADEASAQSAADRAAAGENFATLMQAYAGSALQAKTLGWATRPRMPPELADAAAELPDGATTPMPVKTQYGWHVLHRAESRPFSPPAFETVKEGARQRLIERARSDYLTSLRTKSKVAIGAASPAGG